MPIVQVIKCKCGKIFAACTEPLCYSDAEWIKKVAKAMKRGCTFDLIENNTVKFEECTCKEITNQLKLF